MSLSLIQGYSSAEDDDEDNNNDQYVYSSDEDAPPGGHNAATNHSVNNSFKPLFDPPNPNSASSTLPSALDAFSEIAGPPQFLNNCVEEPPSLAASEGDGQPWRNGRRRNRKEKRDVPAGAVMEAKPQLVGIHDRVRSDAEGSLPQTSSIQPKGSSSTTGAAKRVATATNPKAEDAAELLRMCLQCGIPKTFSNARGIVCPQCGDRPPAEDQDSAKKNKGSTVKDKEKNKRMKGQSSHATWKSETEMQLRQQFD